MAAAGQTLAKLDAILRDDYSDLIIEQTNYKTYMLDRVQRDSSKITANGRRAVFGVEAQPNMSRGAITDGGTLPVPDSEDYADGIVSVKYFAGGFEITDQTVKQAKGSGIIGPLDSLTRGTKSLQKSFKKNINRVIWGDGSGLLASVASGATSATVTVDSVQYLPVGETVDVLQKSNGAVVSVERTVIARSASGKTVTLDASVTVTTAHGLYITGSRNNEFDGLRNMTGHARTLHGIDSSVAGNEYWDGKEVTVSGAVAGESSFIKLAGAVGAGGQDETGMFITTRGIRDRLAATYQSQKRFNDARAVDIHGGYTAIFVNEIPVTYDDDVPKGWVFALPTDMDIFTWHEVAPPDWLDSPHDGTVWHLANSTVAGRRRTAWQAWFVWYAALGITAPNRTGRIPDAQDDDPS